MSDLVKRLREWRMFNRVSLKENELLYEAAAEIERLQLHLLATELRPISEAPRDGTKILAYEKGSQPSWYECWWHQGPRDEQYWMDDIDSEPEPTYFIALSSLPDPDKT